MKTILVASQNPVKSQAVFQAFTKAFPDEIFVVTGASIPSGVSPQPMSSIETREGALNRVRTARERFPEADYWVGIEGGVEHEFGELTSFAWVCILGKSQLGKARSGTFLLPPTVAKLVEAGMELGEADDIIFKRSHSKQNNGAIGLLTHDRVTRTDLYEHAVLLALIPFLSPDLHIDNHCEEGKP